VRYTPMSYLQKLGLAWGMTALIGGFFLVFHPVKITLPLDQGPPRSIVILWESPYGPLGLIVCILGVVLFFRSLPQNTRLLSLGAFLCMCSLGLALAFVFNDYHAWWWHTFPFTFGFGIGLAVVGGFLFGYNLKWVRKVSLLALFLVLPVAVLLASGIAYALYGVTAHGGYLDYTTDPKSYPYPNYISYSGDYLVKAILIYAFQFLVMLGLFVSAAIGFLLNKRRLSRGVPG